MNSNLKRGLFLVTLAGVISISGETAKAADSDKDTEAALPNVGIEAVLNDCYASDEKINVESYLVPTEKESIQIWRSQTWGQILFCLCEVNQRHRVNG